MLVEVVIGIEGNCLETTAASAVRGRRATRLLSGTVRVLLIAVVSRDQVEAGSDRVANAGPIHLKSLRIAIGSVVHESEYVAAYVVESRAQWILRVGILDVHVAGKEFERIELVQRHERISRIVRDGRRQSIRRRIAQRRKLGDLSGGQRCRRDGAVDLRIVCIDR